MKGTSQMNTKRFATILGATVCSAALMVPATAGTAFAHGGGRHGGNHHSGSFNSHHGGKFNNSGWKHRDRDRLTAEQKAAIRAEFVEYKAEVKAAKKVYWNTTADERVELKADLVVAETRADKWAAFKEFKVNTRDERKTLKKALKAAKREYRADVAAIKASV